MRILNSYKFKKEYINNNSVLSGGFKIYMDKNDFLYSNYNLFEINNKISIKKIYKVIQYNNNIIDNTF